MGYTTEFEGSFKLDKPLLPEHKAYLDKFSDTRRMKRKVGMLLSKPDHIRTAVGLPLGFEGAYFVGAPDTGDPWDCCGQAHTPDIIDYNQPPTGQPGLWCQWVPNSEGTAIGWNGAEKFYDYAEWLKYIIAHFLTPWGYVLNGEVSWQGEESSDLGKIVVKDNHVGILKGKVTHE